MDICKFKNSKISHTVPFLRANHCRTIVKIFSSDSNRIKETSAAHQIARYQVAVANNHLSDLSAAGLQAETLSLKCELLQFGRVCIKSCVRNTSSRLRNIASRTRLYQVCDTKNYYSDANHYNPDAFVPDPVCETRALVCETLQLGPVCIRSRMRNTSSHLRNRLSRSRKVRYPMRKITSWMRNIISGSETQMKTRNGFTTVVRNRCTQRRWI